MFATLLSNLQTLISGRFLVTSFFPTLAFWFANAAALFVFNAPFHAYVVGHIGSSTGLPWLMMFAGLLGVAFTAYGEAALLPAIQSIMEGNWPGPLVQLFAPSEMNHYERLNSHITENRRLRGSLGTTGGGQSQAEAWRATLLEARIVGNQVAGNNYTSRDPSAIEIARLAKLRRHARGIPGNDITLAVVHLTMDLRTHNADRPGPNNDFALENTRSLLWELINYADEYAATQYRALVTRRQFEFGALPLAPTRMGNVAKSIQNYSVERYEFNFELLWSRLQLPAQRDKDFGPLLQAAKTQLDFLVSCSALTLVWALLWAILLYFSKGPVYVFLGIAIGGPVVSYAWYCVAVAQYRTLADLLRATIDLFRFDLLTALHYPLPSAVQEERTVWRTVDALHALFELRDLRYAPPK
jgi:hypothetical protein